MCSGQGQLEEYHCCCHGWSTMTLSLLMMMICGGHTPTSPCISPLDRDQLVAIEDPEQAFESRPLGYRRKSKGTINPSLNADYLAQVFSAAGIPNLFTCEKI